MKSKPKMSAPAAAVEILRAEGGPLHIKTITERVQADFDTGLKGKTPAATLGAKLHGDAKKGRTFVKVAPGTFGLLATAEVPEPVEPEVPAEEAPAEEAEPSAAVTPNAKVVRQGRAPQAKPDPKRKAARPRVKQLA